MEWVWASLTRIGSDSHENQPTFSFCKQNNATRRHRYNVTKLFLVTRWLNFFIEKWVRKQTNALLGTPKKAVNHSVKFFLINRETILNFWFICPPWVELSASLRSSPRCSWPLIALSLFRFSNRRYKTLWFAVTPGWLSTPPGMTLRITLQYARFSSGWLFK